MKNKATAILKKYIGVMGLQDWQINIVFSKEKNHEGAAATANPDPKYKTVTITIYKCAFEKPNDIEYIIKHELAHCITEQLYLYCYDFLNGKYHAPSDIELQREQTTDWIARIVK